MELEQKLDEFINDKDSHAFLVQGPWGVGKTYAVESWLKELEKANSGYKIVKLSLFGVSNVNELNSLTLSSESFRNKFKKWIGNIGENVSVGVCGISVSLPLIGMVSSVLKMKHSGKYLFVLDDIERKDNSLTIEEIFGFVDSLPPKNTKVILIANLDKIDKLDIVKGFKEKVIQDEFDLETPTPKAISSIITKKYLSCINKPGIPITNLRTLIRFKDILRRYESDIDENLVACIYLCCLNRYENRLGKDELIQNARNNIIKAAKIFNIQDNYMSKTEEEIDKLKRSVNSDRDALYHNIQILNLLTGIKENSLKAFIDTVYKYLADENYKDLFAISIPLREKPRKQYEETGVSIFYSSNPDNEYLKIMQKIYSLLRNQDYDLLSILNQFLLIVFRYSEDVSDNSVGKEYEKKIINECPKIIAQYLFENSNYIDTTKYHFFLFREKDKFIGLKNSIIKEYCELVYKYFLQKAKNISLKLEDFTAKKNVLYELFDMSDDSCFNPDEIILEALKHIENILKHDLNPESWDYCLNLADAIKGRTDRPKSIDYLEKKAGEESLSGRRYKFLWNRVVQ